LSNVQLTNAGNYAVTVTNLYGSTNSSNAMLTVLTAPPCDPPPSGIVSWWPAEGNADDVIGTNNGILQNGSSFTNGEAGQAFFFPTTNSGVKVPASPSLNVGLSNGLTIEGWINPSSLASRGYISEWNNGNTNETEPYGVQLTILSPGELGLGAGNLFSDVHDTDGNVHWIMAPGGTVNANTFQHVALTYDKTSGVATLYCDGVIVAQQNLGSFTPLTSYDFYIGRRPPGLDAPGSFSGSIDELSVYNRALSSNEIAAIYNAGSGGKCSPMTPSSPVITQQPTNQTVVVGESVTFSVTAIGTTPFSYQWSFNGTNNPVVGATNATLTLSNVQLTNAGNYAVTVTNLYGSTNSSIAMLTVLTAPPCDPPPSGIVSWWPAEGNAADVIGTNNGILDGTISFASGEVGQAFLYNTTNADVRIPASPGLNLGASNGFTLEAWICPSNVAVYGPLFEWNNGSGTWGVHFFTGVEGAGSLFANIIDSGNNWHEIYSSPGVVASNVFQHVALTYDESSGVATIYCNGAVVAQQTLGSFTPLTTYDLYLGRRASAGAPQDLATFSGLIDEPAVYGRALSSNEIAAIYNAGSGGKCSPTPSLPVITSQPTNQTVVVGQTATFSVTAIGTTPFSYQWYFNGTNNPIAGATNATLTLSNVQLTNAGNYAVTVTNLYGSTNSSNAMLTVNPLIYFVWNPIPSPRFVNLPFAVTIQAMSLTNGLATNFTGTVILKSTNGISIHPPVSSAFVQGVWTGAVAVIQTATNLVLQASDELGQSGFANAINVVGLPPLTTVPSGSTLYIFWPVNPSGFVLETSPNLSPAQWIPVTNPPIQIGDQYLLPVQMSGTNAFYRLYFSEP
jgi:hypothetical protein